MYRTPPCMKRKYRKGTDAQILNIQKQLNYKGVDITFDETKLLYNTINAQPIYMQQIIRIVVDGI